MRLLSLLSKPSLQPLSSIGIWTILYILGKLIPVTRALFTVPIVQLQYSPPRAAAAAAAGSPGARLPATPHSVVVLIDAFAQAQSRWGGVLFVARFLLSQFAHLQYSSLMDVIATVVRLLSLSLLNGLSSRASQSSALLAAFAVSSLLNSLLLENTVAALSGAPAGRNGSVIDAATPPSSFFSLNLQLWCRILRCIRSQAAAATSSDPAFPQPFHCDVSLALNASMFVDVLVGYIFGARLEECHVLSQTLGPSFARQQRSNVLRALAFTYIPRLLGVTRRWSYVHSDIVEQLSGASAEPFSAAVSGQSTAALPTPPVHYSVVLDMSPLTTVYTNLVGFASGVGFALMVHRSRSLVRAALWKLKVENPLLLRLLRMQPPPLCIPDAIQQLTLPELMQLVESCQANASSSSFLLTETEVSRCICPITQCLMLQPVDTVDGHTYEMEAIREWLREGHRTSPMTNLDLPSTQLTANFTVRKQITQLVKAVSAST